MTVVLNIEKAACELVWEHLFPGEKTPEAVRLLGRYDVWDHTDEPFQWGMRQHRNTWPENQELWNNLFDKEMHLIGTVATGKILLEYRDSENSKYCKFICI